MEPTINTVTTNDNYKCLEKEVIITGRWLEMSEVTYQDPRGNKKIWESVSRTTRPPQSDTDSVGIIAILKRTLRRDCYILVKQFRPPLNALTIEFPAGLIRTGEMPSETALRELREETGYIGKVKSVGPPVAVDPGISNNTVRMVTVEIDGDNSNNENPVQRTIDQHLIQVVRVPVNELLEKLKEFNEQGIISDSRLQAFSLGLVKGAPKKYLLKPAESVDEK